ncbi:phytoene synthase [Halomicrobium zhouii]|uniref:Phytoene synthase n=1 Tax=Halomicrobium zhouii TaxID=767519 RepID=A0A1I6LC32_9EURY|nr:phytoene/squalene synthase family protein [Halomicrobium zhouii]SFS00987.1 phytoene synthase [Halomicrobium zhouii]
MSQPSGGFPDDRASTRRAEPVAESKAIQRRTGATFHLATRVLPQRVRHATYVLYAFFRVADDVVDDPDPGPPAEQRRELERMREAAHGRIDSDDAVVTAFHRIADEHDVSPTEIDEFVDAMLRDVEGADYETYADLEAYLRGSSVAVANMMLAVMDPPQADEARPHARALAEAFQLTNFVRDVREDVRDYDRVYLPKATLREYGVSTDDVRALDPSPAIRRAVRSELRRTERRYRDGVAGIRMLPPDCQFAVLLSATLYAEHHRLIRARDFDVLTGRPSLSTARRLVVLARTWAAWKRFDDPETVFYHVSPVPETEDVPQEVQTTGAGRRGRLSSAIRDRTPQGLGAVGSVVPWRSD